MTPALRILCPNFACRSILLIPSRARGKQVRCRKCGMKIEVPSAEAASAAVPAEVEQPREEEAN